MLRERPEILRLFNNDNAFSEDIEDALDHGVIVSNLAFRLSDELGFEDSFCKEMAEAGMIHDIGKLELGDYLYGRRKEALKIEEIKYVRMHPTLGYKFLSEKNVCNDVILQTVYHHHENYDGSGYPDNLKGEMIPVGARILRVCDVYAALVSERPYRAAFDQETAMDLMIDEVKNFDMKMFLAFMKVVHSDKYQDIQDYISRINKKMHMKVS